MILCFVALVSGCATNGYWGMDAVVAASGGPPPYGYSGLGPGYYSYYPPYLFPLLLPAVCVQVVSGTILARAIRVLRASLWPTCVSWSCLGFWSSLASAPSRLRDHGRIARRPGRYYGCGYYRTRGTSVCKNSLVLEQDLMDAVVLSAIRKLLTSACSRLPSKSPDTAPCRSGNTT